MSEPKNAFSIQEFCRRNNVGRTKVYAEIGAGRLKARKIGTKTVVMAEDETAWLAALPSMSPKAA
jgi:hypothetical protein